jgi:uncharacterized protein (DUF885 family)
MLETVRTFTSLSEEFVEESLRRWPVEATAAGIHDYDHQLPDDSPDGFRDRAAWLRDLEQRLAASVTWEELPAEQRVDFAVLRSRLSVMRAGIEELRAQERDPVRPLETALGGIALLVVRPFAPLDDRKEAVLARLMAVPDHLAGARATLGRVPAGGVELAIEVAAGAPGFVNDVVRWLLRAFPGDSERIEHAGVRANAGFASYHEALERELGPAAGGEPAIGARWVEFLLEREHLLTPDPAALEELARAQLARLRGLLEQEAARLEPERPWSAIEQALGAGPALTVAGAEAELERVKRFAVEHRLVPETAVSLTVERVPLWQRPLVPAVGYVAPAPFDIEPSAVLSVPVGVGRTAAPALHGPRLALALAREGWPGRHLQAALASQAGSRLRRITASPLLTDGWAAYAEELMIEEGFGADPAYRLALLLDLVAGAARAVADLALHTGRMDLAGAADFLAGQGLMATGEALAEARRIARTPVASLGALFGRLQILELREEARRRLGPRYDRLDLHAALLACGALPIGLLREELWDRLGVGA